MNRPAAMLAAKSACLIGGLVLSVAGCAISGGEPARRGHAVHAPAAGAEGTSAVPPRAPEHGAQDAPAHAQTSFVGDLVGPAGKGRHGACPPLGPHGHRPPAPHGYAPQPALYNRYGIDPQEFLCDGGDRDPQATLRHNDSIVGLDPEDTVVHYTTEAGEVEFQASNRACVYAPRFASVRKVTGAASGQGIIGAVGVERPVGPNRFEFNQPGLVLADTVTPGRSSATRQLDAMRDRNRGVPVEGVRQLEQATDVLAALAGLSVLELDRLQREELAALQRAATAAVTWSTNLTLEVAVEDVRPPVLTSDQSVEGVTVYDFPEAGRLGIIKLADRQDAEPGEIVSFMVRVENVGDSPVSHVVVADNLTTRLEYVEGSQSCDVEAEFLAEPNDVGSTRLEWQLSEELPVGESVTIRFECRVR